MTQPAATKVTVSGVASLVIGMVCIVIGLSSAFGFIPALLGLAFGFDGLRHCRAGQKTGETISIFGIVTNAVALVLAVGQLIAAGA
jgi:hypothetical protein